MHEPHRTVSTWMVKATTFALVIAFIAIASALYGAQSTWSVIVITPGSSGQSEQGLTVPTSVPTDPAGQLVRLTPSDWMSPTPYPTDQPYPTTAPIPNCKEGEAVEGQVCIAYPNTPTASIETPIPICKTPVLVGTTCIWSLSGRPVVK